MMLTVIAPDSVPEVRPGDDLAGLVVDALGRVGAPEDGDVVLVTSKVVSKAEGRARRGHDRAVAVAEELAEPGARVVARRGPTTIVRTRLGLTMAAAGVDASNVEVGTVLLLPLDPDGTARDVRREIARRRGVNVAVIVTDTAGRAWRTGQTDIAIGAAGLLVLDDHTGRTDPHGNQLTVTAPAVADELAGAAELAQGKLAARPFAVVRGRADLVLPPGDDGAGAGALLRGEGEDLFGFGAREAVVRALGGHPVDRIPFGAPASVEELQAALTWLGCAHEVEDGSLVAAPDPRLAALAFSHGWRFHEGTEKAVFLPPTP